MTENMNRYVMHSWTHLTELRDSVLVKHYAYYRIIAWCAKNIKTSCDRADLRNYTTMVEENIYLQMVEIM